eukprot:8376291-Pyramimonas_sp.AAC.1
MGMGMGRVWEAAWVNHRGRAVPNKCTNETSYHTVTHTLYLWMAASCTTHTTAAPLHHCTCVHQARRCMRSTLASITALLHHCTTPP